MSTTTTRKHRPITIHGLQGSEHQECRDCHEQAWPCSYNRLIADLEAAVRERDDYARLLGRHFSIGTVAEYNALSVDISSVLDVGEPLGRLDAGYRVIKAERDEARGAVEKLADACDRLLEITSLDTDDFVRQWGAATLNLEVAHQQAVAFLAKQGASV